MAVTSQQPMRTAKRAKTTKKVTANGRTDEQRPFSTEQPGHSNEPMPLPTEPTGCLTPCERLQRLLEAKPLERDTTVVSTVSALHDFVKAKERPKKIIIRMKLLWISDHAYQDWKLVRLHLVDAEAPETLDYMLKVFKAPYEEKTAEINSILLTATLWHIESDSEFLPAPGTVIDINECSSLQLYRDDQCQLTTRLKHLSWERHEP